MARLASALGLPEPLCTLLAVRGIDEPSGAKAFLRPLLSHMHDPRLLRDAERASERIGQAIRGGEKILVHGDYDVDGVCAAALLTRVLRSVGGRVEAFVPNRLTDGYDFGPAGLRRALEVGASLVVTADCGVAAHGSVQRAAAEGIDVVVTDHHTPGTSLPQAVAVVDPKRSDCDYPTDDLCGAGVAFKVATLVAEQHGVDHDELVWYLDLVALATVADLMPLSGENRALVKYGLRVLAETRNAGVRALLSSTGLDGKPSVGAGQVGFVLAPRINAAGRVGDAAEALDLLLTEDPSEAARLSRSLEGHNQTRREEERRTLDGALELLDRDFDPMRDCGVVLAQEGWHPGVIGIVASRVVERIHRPTVLVALSGAGGRGSARSIPGFHLFDAIRGCGEHLTRFGGHRHAAGLDVTRTALPAFVEAFKAEAARRLEGTDLLRRELRIDLELPLDQATLALCETLRHLEPHGAGNRRPVFVARGVEATGARSVGSGHLKVTLSAGGTRLDGIGFDLAERLTPVAAGTSPVDVVFQLEPNEFRGRKRAQARVLDMRAALPPPGKDGTPEGVVAPAS